MNNDPDAARTAGQLVNFVCFEMGKSSAPEFRFQARCHFLPKIDECVEHQRMLFRVTRIYHHTVTTPESDAYPFTVANVVCGFLGKIEDQDSKLRTQLESLSRNQSGPISNKS